MSETNQDSSSKAPNMLLQALMPTPLPNPKPEKPGKFDDYCMIICIYLHLSSLNVDVASCT